MTGGHHKRSQGRGERASERAWELIVGDDVVWVAGSDAWAARREVGTNCTDEVGGADIYLVATKMIK